jgi:CRP-like cAMP-binding protein
MVTSKDKVGVKHRLDHDAEPGASRNLVIPTHNLILAALPPAEANRIVAVSKPVQLLPPDVVYEAGDEIEYVYFPVDSVMATVGVLEDGSSVEISMSGREGIVGLPALIGGGRALHWTRVSVGGTALRISSASLNELSRASEPISDAIMCAYRNLYTQICQRSICNVRHTLLQRLSVWLLMIHDRVGSHDLPFTQEDISNRISVRRAGVSVAASLLQAMHAITYHRGKIIIQDRLAIESTACECYSVMVQDFEKDPVGRRSTPRTSCLIGVSWPTLSPSSLPDPLRSQ